MAAASAGGRTQKIKQCILTLLCLIDLDMPNRFISELAFVGYNQFVQMYMVQYVDHQLYMVAEVGTAGSGT